MAVRPMSSIQAISSPVTALRLDFANLVGRYYIVHGFSTRIQSLYFPYRPDRMFDWEGFLTSMRVDRRRFHEQYIFSRHSARGSVKCGLV